MKLNTVFIAIALATVSEAYSLDVSCENSNILNTMIDDAFLEAAKQAQAAIDALATRPWNRALPQDKAYSDLGAWIFHDAGLVGPQDKPVIPAPDNRGNLDKVRDILLSVLTMKDKIPKSAAVRAEHVIVYCNLNRFKPKAPKPVVGSRWYDAEMQSWLQIEDERKENLMSCKDAGGGSAGAAWTVNNGADGLPSEIQLCPPYLAEFGPKRYKTSRKILTAIQSIAKVPAMDKMSVLDNTILHELTHTWAGGSTGDVRGPTLSYGWENVVDFGDGSQAIQNAESINFFALGARMIAQQNLIPQHDGSMVKGP